MALFERDHSSLSAGNKADEEVLFPTEPAFVVPVAVRDTAQYGGGHKGVFALTNIPSGTKYWIWTDRIKSIHFMELEDFIIANEVKDVQLFLRQGFVLPDKLDFFHTNPTDAGRYINHSSTPNCGADGALRDILAGEEMTMDYAWHGNPDWYKVICAKYGVLTEAQVAAAASL